MVLKDDGVPKLSKTTFRMPGYRQILASKEEEAYTINNEKIYEHAHRRNKMKKTGVVVTGSSYDDQNVFQDIVPIEDCDSERTLNFPAPKMRAHLYSKEKKPLVKFNEPRSEEVNKRFGEPIGIEKTTEET